MENGCNMYRQRYTSDSCNTDRERCTDIIITAGPHISGDTVGNGGGSSSGSGCYFTSPSHLDWTSSPYSLVYAPTANASGFHELLLPSRLSSPAGSSAQPDPHLTRLQLGKRHCFEFGEGIGASSAFSDGGSRRGRRVYCSGGAMGVVRCQVDGCDAPLGRAKEYHRRHRVCEVHAKAPVVVVVGRHQRFCQQCSRFHAVSEFDESKRSCRRRLAGHNERRRKSSHDNVPRARTSYQGGALSLLSSRTDACRSDLSLRCSAALRELIAEHRATILAHQLVLERNRLESDPINSHSLASKCMHQEGLPSLPAWARADEVGSQVTLDLMQGTSSAFGLLSMRAKQQQEEGYEIWNYSEGV